MLGIYLIVRDEIPPRADVEKRGLHKREYYLEEQIMPLCVVKRALARRRWR